MNSRFTDHFGFQPPELINRLDEQIVFNALSPTLMPGLVDLRLEEVRKLLETKRLTMDITPDAKQWLADKGYSFQFGARALNRLIAKQVRAPVADLIIRGDLK